MKISCTQENLNQGLSVVSHIASKSTNLPILSNVLIKVEDKLINFSATNLEIGITISIRGKIETDGDFSVNARLLSDYISLLPKERIDIDLEDDNLNIKCLKQKTKIKGQSATDFPLIPIIKKENPRIINAQVFKQAISEVIFAVSTSETRPEISGVFVKFTNNEIILAATDSYRLTEKKLKINNSSDKEDVSLIIPVKTLQELLRILGIFRDNISLEDVENLEIYLSNNQIMFSYNGVDLISRLIEGQYPDYTQIIPTVNKNQIKVNTANLIKAVKTSSLFTKTGIYDIKLDFNTEAKEIVISSSSSQTGENISSVEADISGETTNIVLNYRYLLDGLQNINSENVLIELNNNNNPLVVKSDVSEDYVYIIMPIKQ